METILYRLDKEKFWKKNKKSNMERKEHYAASFLIKVCIEDFVFRAKNGYRQTQ